MPTAPPFRPINYLGSKLRLVETIRQLADEVDPARGTFCDLFAGSGTVSAGLVGQRAVVAVDIQEYARVLCSAVLAPPPGLADAPERALALAAAAEPGQDLLWALAPLLAHEDRALAAAAAGEPTALFDIVEQGSLLALAEAPAAVCAPALLEAMGSAAERLRQVGLDRGPDSVITRHLGGPYFSYRQAAWLDGLARAARTAPPALRDTLLALTLSSASEVVGTVGKHFAQPLRPRGRDGRPKRGLVAKLRLDRALAIPAVYAAWAARYRALPRNPHAAVAQRADYGAFLDEHRAPLGVIYADPPYTRDHYSRFYHALETICLGDEPRVSRVPGRGTPSRGAYREDRHQSPFCIRSQAPGAFARLLRGARDHDVPLILSYSPDLRSSGGRPRLMAVEDILALASTCYRRVELRTVARATHSKLNRVERNAPVRYGAEVFVVCRP